MPVNACFLLIGAFPGWQLTQKAAAELAPDDWYYGTNSRSLWYLLEQVYGIPLSTKAAKQALLAQLGLGITDVVASARRKGQNSQDAQLAAGGLVFSLVKQLVVSRGINFGK